MTHPFPVQWRLEKKQGSLVLPASVDTSAVAALFDFVARVNFSVVPAFPCALGLKGVDCLSVCLLWWVE